MSLSDESEYTSEIEPSEATFEMSKLELMIRDNRTMQAKIKNNNSFLETKNQELLQVHEHMKRFALSVKHIFEENKKVIDKQQNDIAWLKSEKMSLQMGKLNVNGDADNPEDAELRNEYRSTLDALSAQLKKREREIEMQKIEHENQMAALKQLWDARELKVREQLMGMKQNHDAELNEQLQQLHNHHQMTEAQLKAQVTSLINEQKLIDEEKKNYKAKMLDHQELSQRAEMDKYNLNKECKTWKDKVKSLEEQLLQITQELVNTSGKLKEKENSLDQLFEVYNKQREDMDRLKNPNQSPAHLEYDKIYARYLCAEETLKKKNDEIAKLSKKIEEVQIESSTQIMIYRQQAEIFKKDFEMEREARQKLHSEAENLKTIVGQYQIEMEKMKQDLTRCQSQHVQTRQFN